MTDFAWLIEAPGQNYLGTREIAYYPEFHWTKDHNAALRFISKEQADGVMMVVRRVCPELFAFAVNLGDARPVEHGWIAAKPTPEAVEDYWIKGPIPEDGSVNIADVEVRGIYWPEHARRGEPMPFNYTHWRPLTRKPGGQQE